MLDRNGSNSVDQQSEESKKVALIIGCGKAKIWQTKPWLGPVRARDAYVGPLFRACRRYAEAFYPDDWFIFSARYGLLNPNERIRNYDTTFANRGTVGTSPDDQLRTQFANTLMGYDVVVSFAGSAYNSRLAGFLLDKHTLKLPLAALPLFDRMRWLKRAVLNKGV
jgi:hypothetical protein